eukprot:5413868-Karenia_brevis.AAC.1
MSQSELDQKDMDGSPSGKNAFKINRAKESKVKFLHTLLKLWLPFKRVFHISAILDEQGADIPTECGVAQALASG